MMIMSQIKGKTISTQDQPVNAQGKSHFWVEMFCKELSNVVAELKAELKKSFAWIMGAAVMTMGWAHRPLCSSSENHVYCTYVIYGHIKSY